VLPPVPAPLRPRVLHEHDGARSFCLEDDRAPQRLALVGGALAVAGLFASLGWLGVIWPGALASVLLSAAVVGVVRHLPRRTTQLTVSARSLRIDGEPRPWPAPVALEGPWLTVGDDRVPLHGESDEAREALVEHLREVAALSRSAR